MNNTIVFIHGMFQNARSWDGWVAFFEARGYNCIVPSWPLHQGDPEELRKNIPAGLGDLELDDVVAAMEAALPEAGGKSIVIGHSVGGLIAQLLINKNLAAAAVAISTVAPNRMLSLDWGFFKNSISITNPFKGDEPFYMTPEGFHEAFANCLSAEASNASYLRTATHDSRNVLRTCMGASGHIDIDAPHAPMLFIGGEADQIIPAALVEKNCEAYTDASSIASYEEFAGRGHFICNEPGWEEVAAYVDGWLSGLHI